MLNLFVNGIILVSAGILVGSLITLRRLVHRLPPGPGRRGWDLMAVLTLFFLIGYLAYLIIFWSQPVNWPDLIVPWVFFCTACFVWLAYYLSLQSAIDVRRITLLEHENITDPLTGMYNRRFLERRLHEEYSRFERYAAPLCVILVDIDHFKSVNDLYGHQAGDLALNYVAKMIRKTIRTSDVAGRYGGDEFMVITPSIHTGTAGVLAERIRQNVAAQPFLMNDGTDTPREIPLTVSAGVMGASNKGDTIQNLIHEVDIALYHAKQAGRNRVIVGDAMG